MAPEPDIRVRRTPGSARHRGERLADGGLRADGGRLEIVALVRQPVDDRRRAFQSAGGVGAVGRACAGRRHRRDRRRRSATGRPGLTSTACSGGRRGSIGQPVAPALGPGGAGAQAHRAVGADDAGDGFQRRVVEIAGPAALARQPQRRARVGRAAAQTGGDRQVLVQGHAPARLADPGGLAQRAQGLEDQVVAARPPGLRRTGPSTLSDRPLGRLDRDQVADVGEGDQAGERMIAVGRPPARHAGTD